MNNGPTYISILTTAITILLILTVPYLALKVLLIVINTAFIFWINSDNSDE